MRHNYNHVTLATLPLVLFKLIQSPIELQNSLDWFSNTLTVRSYSMALVL